MLALGTEVTVEEADTLAEFSFKFYGQFTELQSHRMAEVGRDLWRSSGPTPCSSRVT